MRAAVGSILALAILAGAAAAHAKNAGPEGPSGATTQPGETTTKDKVKDRLLRFVDDVQAFAPWIQNEPSFEVTLTRVRQELAVADEQQLAPLLDFEPHLSHLGTTLARMRARMEPVRAAAELCDPARAKDLFLLLLDTLDAQGQRGVTSTICKKLGTGQEASESLAQVCRLPDLAFVAAKSVHDLVLQCDPTLGRASVDSAAQYEQLRTDLQGVKVGVEETVHEARRDLTQALSVVGGHVADVSSYNTTTLQDTIRGDRDDILRLEIEKALVARAPYGMLYLPEAFGGQLESVREIVVQTIANVVASGEDPNDANQKLAAADGQLAKKRYKRAFRLYGEAYAAAVGTMAGQP